MPIAAVLAIAGIIGALYATRPRVRSACPVPPGGAIPARGTGTALPARSAATRLLGFTLQEVALVVTFVVAAVIAGLALGGVFTY